MGVRVGGHADSGQASTALAARPALKPADLEDGTRTGYGTLGRRAQPPLRREPFQAAPSAISISFSTVFQFLAVFGTPMTLSNLAASFDVPKPLGVWR